jgi:predicted homoserine dehydrogenase-like protein
MKMSECPGKNREYPEKNRGIKICFIGAGAFAKGFVPLFKAHPYVEKVAVCDLIKENAEKYSKDFQIEVIDTFEEVLKSEYDSVANDDIALLLRTFSIGLIDLDVLTKELKYKKLNDQYSFHTEKALRYLKLLGGI